MPNKDQLWPSTLSSHFSHILYHSLVTSNYLLKLCHGYASIRNAVHMTEEETEWMNSVLLTRSLGDENKTAGEQS